MASIQYDERRPLTVTVAGISHTGAYRVLDGTVIVYFGWEIRSAQYGMDRPETVARWLLLDICKKAEAKERKGGSVKRQLRLT